MPISVAHFCYPACLAVIACSGSPTATTEPTSGGASMTAAGAAGAEGPNGASGSDAAGVGGASTAGSGALSGSAGADLGGGAGTAGSTGGGSAGAAGSTAGGGGASAGASGAGPTSGSACPAENFLCEAFDSYPAGAAPTGIWTKTTRGGGAITVDTTRAFSGSQSLHATGTLNGDVAHVTTPLSIAANTVYVRFMMYTVGYPSSSGVHSRLARLGTTADSGPDSAYSLSSYNGTAIEKVDSIYLRSTSVHLNDAAYKNRWFCLEFEIDKSGGVGKVVPHIWIDGTALTLAAAGSSTHAGTSTSWDPIPFEKFTLGLEGNQVDAVKGDYWLDDVIIAPQRIGCPAKP